MHPVIDPLLILQLLGAVLIVFTLPEESGSPHPEAASMPAAREPFQLSDGNTYVEHAGMAVEAHRIQSLNITG